MKTIFLLTGEAEAEALGQHLRTHNPQLEVIPAIDRSALDQACASMNPSTRLISFCSSAIVPKAHLAAIPCGSYNFHPPIQDAIQVFLLSTKGLITLE